MKKPGSKKKRLTRRRFLFYSAGLGIAAAATAGYARFVESEWIELIHRRVELQGKKLRRPIRVLHISDLHASKHVSIPYIAGAISLGLSAEPDLICVTGDFITSRHHDREDYVLALRRLSDAAPTYGCIGNHDGGWWISMAYDGFPDTGEVTRLMEESGIECLYNSSRSIELHGQRVHVAGVADLYSREVYPSLAFEGVPRETDEPVILLSHNPDTKRLVRPYGWDLMLSGHTHGGQVAFPFFGAPFVAIRDRRYARGLNRWRNRWIHTSRGIGNILGVRFNCRPEVTLLELT